MNYTLYVGQSTEVIAKLSNYGDAMAVARLYVNVDKAFIEIDYVNGWKWLRLTSGASHVVISMRQSDYIPEDMYYRDTLKLKVR